MSSFKASLRSGDLGETLFFSAHAGELKKESGRVADFSCIQTQSTLELKTDYYDMNATPNFFFERWSNKEKETCGGPWRAQLEGIDFFVYFYVQNLTYFKFETLPLVKYLDGVIDALKPVPVRNATYTTIGYKVPRANLAALSTEVKMEVRKKP